MPADATLVRNWLKMIGALNIGAMEPDEIEWRLAVLAPALAEEFAASVFTPETARTVARQSSYFPTFGEICKALEPLAKQHRESRAILALPFPRGESREPYQLPPPPPERLSRHFGRVSRDEIHELVQDPLRTVAQQLAALGFAEPPPLKAAAAPIVAETKRGPPVDA